jgi:hypothetical protein
MLRAVNTEEDALFTSQPSLTLYAQLVRRLLIQRVRVTELADIMLAEVGEVEWFEIPGTRRPRQLPVRYNSIASIPPADGTCHFDKLPAELLKAIFSASLPPRSQIIEPRCGGARTESLEKRELRPNRVADLMVLNKKLCLHVAEVLYEERTYSIHVHQGLMNAGIEFLHVGRQPLQYQADVKDGRFAKFGPGEVFGFSRLKKLEINIYPGDGKCRHTAINTYYMLLALVNLLSNRDDEPGNRITSLDISFVATYSQPHNVMQGRSTIMTAESPWWDAANNKPRETSFHGISDIQLMLQPFARLFGVHNVDIIAPVKVAGHQPTVEFVRALKRCMQGRSQSATFNHTSLNAQLEGMRAVHEDYMLRVLYGGFMVEDDKLDDVRDDNDDNDDNDENDEAGDGPDDGRRDIPHDAGKDDGPDNDGDDDSSDDDDEDDGPDAGMLGGQNVEHKKHGLSTSPSSSNARGGRKRVHFSDDTSSGDGPSGQGERSQVNPDDSPTSGDNVFGSRFLATEAEIDSIERFAMICGTTEEDARFWLTRSDWDIDIAVLNFMASLEVENTGDEDGMRRAIALSLQDLMTAEDHRAPARDGDMRAGRELDSGTSPTRSSRADRPYTCAGAQNQPTPSSSAYGPHARTFWPPRRLLASYARQDEEAEGMKYNGKGKGKGKAKKTNDDDEEDGPVWKGYSRYDESISRWNNPSDFFRQDDNFEPYNAHDTEMADAEWEPYPTAQPAASDTGGAAGPSQGPSLAEGNEFAELYTARVREWVAQESDADARVRDLDQKAAALLDVANSSGDLSVDRPQSQSYSGAPGTVYVPDHEDGPQSQSHSGAPGSMDVPATAAPARPGSRLLRMSRPRVDSEQYQRRRTLRDRLVAAELAALEPATRPGPADLAASDPAATRSAHAAIQSLARPDLLQTLERFLGERKTAQLAARIAASDPTIPDTLQSISSLLDPIMYDQQQQPAPAPPAPSIPANTVDDYPQWAGTSYWSAPVADEPAPAPAPTPTPAPEVPTASSSSPSAHTRNTSQYVVPTPRTTVRQTLDSTTKPSGSRFLRPISSTQDGVAAPDAVQATAAPTMPISATPAPAPPSAATVIPVGPYVQYLANQNYWANLRAEFGDEDVDLSSDSEGEL